MTRKMAPEYPTSERGLTDSQRYWADLVGDCIPEEERPSWEPFFEDSNFQESVRCGLQYLQVAHLVNRNKRVGLVVNQFPEFAEGAPPVGAWMEVWDPDHSDINYLKLYICSGTDVENLVAKLVRALVVENLSPQEMDEYSHSLGTLR